MLQALAHAADGDRGTALGVLGQALTDAPEPEHHVRLFLDEGDRCWRCCATLLRASTAIGRWCGRGREALLAVAQESADEPVAQQLVDPLSQREIDVLRLLDSELTGPQIAAELYVSLNTLRTHTKRIFTKLDVRTRAAAVRRAHEQDLL